MLKSLIAPIAQGFHDLPFLVRFVLRHSLLGYLYGAAIAGAFLLSNLGGVRDLIATSAQPIVPAIMLFSAFAITIGSAYVGAAIMLLPDDES
jgi:hypothetical protein